MKSILGLSWANKNSQRNYPFVDSANMMLGTVGFIPNDLIVDARIYLRNTYKAEEIPYLSRVELTPDRAIFTVACQEVVLGTAEVPYSLINSPVSEQTDTYQELNSEDKFAVRTLLKGGLTAGMFVIKLAGLAALQSLDQTAYDIEAGTINFVPAVCEYLPGPQVTSANEMVGSVTLRGESGIKVERLNNTDIKISIVGDPHFTRYGCLDASVNQGNDIFLERLKILHYESPTKVTLTTIDVKENAEDADNISNNSIRFQLNTANNLGVNERPALRISVNGNRIHFSMAGA